MMTYPLAKKQGETTLDYKTLNSEKNSELFYLEKTTVYENGNFRIKKIV